MPEISPEERAKIAARNAKMLSDWKRAEGEESVKERILRGLGLTTALNEPVCPDCGLAGEHSSTCKHKPARPLEAIVMAHAESTPADKKALVEHLWGICKANGWKHGRDDPQMIRKAILYDPELIVAYQRFAGRRLSDLQGIVMSFQSEVLKAENPPSWDFKYEAADGSIQHFVVNGQLSREEALRMLENEKSLQRTIKRNNAIRQAEFDAKRAK